MLNLSSCLMVVVLLPLSPFNALQVRTVDWGYRTALPADKRPTSKERPALGELQGNDCWTACVPPADPGYG